MARTHTLPLDKLLVNCEPGGTASVLNIVTSYGNNASTNKRCKAKAKTLKFIERHFDHWQQCKTIKNNTK